MKTIQMPLVLSLLLSLVSAQASRASCVDGYRARIAILGDHQLMRVAFGAPGAALAVPVGGLATGAVAIKYFGVRWKGELNTLATKGGRIIGGLASAALLASLVSAHLDKNDAENVLELLKEAEAGHGLLLRDQYAKASATRSDLDFDSFVSALRAANERDVFCSAEGPLFKMKDVMTWAETEPGPELREWAQSVADGRAAKAATAEQVALSADKQTPSPSNATAPVDARAPADVGARASNAN